MGWCSEGKLSAKEWIWSRRSRKTVSMSVRKSDAPSKSPWVFEIYGCLSSTDETLVNERFRLVVIDTSRQSVACWGLS